MKSFVDETVGILHGESKDELKSYIESLKLIETIKNNQKGDDLNYMLLKLRLKSQLISNMAIKLIYT